MPAPGQEETVRIVALDRDFHVQCYRCEVSQSTCVWLLLSNTLHLKQNEYTISVYSQIGLWLSSL